VGIRCADHVTPHYPQKLALTPPTGGGRSVGIVRSWTRATEFDSVNLLHRCPILTSVDVFYIRVSVHGKSILIRSNKLQQYAGIYLLQNHSLRVSGVHRTHHQENIQL